MPFQIHALSGSGFEPLFSLSDGELAKLRAARVVVDASPGYPCRISLVDAEIGETVMLVNYEHQAADSPFRSAHAIYVRENAGQSFPDVGVVPQLFENRLISVRAFDARDYIVDAEVVDGSKLQEAIPELFRNARVACLHLHNARLGCYLARATRA